MRKPDPPVPSLLEAESFAPKPGARRIGPIFVAAAVLLVVSTIFVYRVGLMGIRAGNKMAGELLVLRQLDDFLSSLKDAETGQRGYLLTGDAPYLQPYMNVRAQVRTKLESLQQLAQAGELSKDRVDRVATLAQQKFSELEQTIQLRRDNGLDAALAIVRDNHGKQVMDEIRTEIEQLRADEEKEFGAASRSANRAVSIRTQAFIGMGLLNLVFLGWAFRKISGEVQRRETAMLETSQQKELLATTLASIGDAVIATDASGRVVFLNPEAETLTGWKSSDAAGRSLPEVFRIINEGTREPIENPVEKVLRLGTVVGLANHTILIRKDGAELPIDDSAAPIRHANGPLFGVVLVFRDFTEHNQRTRQLAEQAHLIDLSNDAMFASDMQARITYWNKAAEEIYGYSRAEALGKRAHELLQTQFPEPFEVINAKLRRDHRWSGELVHTRRDGSRLITFSRWALDHDAKAQPAFILETNNDITERKRAEEALREAHEQLASRAVHLEKLVDQRTSKLNETIGDLESFSYSIVHDLRAPLRAMQSFAQLLANECAPISATANDYVRRITTAAERMDRLIQDVLSYSRVARTELPLIPFDAGDLLRGMIATYPSFQPPHAHVQFEGDIPLVLATEAALTQCFSNLLGNAVKFVEPGVMPRVRVWSETPQGRVRLLFQDNGIGIEKSAHERIFQMFQRLSKRYEGTGIGLTIVKKAVEKMGGSLGLESEPGKGSTFWLELAAADVAPKSSAAPTGGAVS